MNQREGVRIEWATEGDVPLILAFIRELAEYERLQDQVVATEERLRRSLFAEHAGAEVILAYLDDAPVGYALFYHSYSSFLGSRGLYLEDLYVKPEARARGIGRRLMAFLARLADERDCGRLEWCVLDWNAPAIRYYEKLGAQAMNEWALYRLTGEALDRLAADP